MHVVAQETLQRRYSSSSGNVRNSLAEAGFDERLIASNVARLKTIVGRMTATGAETPWADYALTNSYDNDEFQAKLDFVMESAGAPALAARLGSWLQCRRFLTPRRRARRPSRGDGRRLDGSDALTGASRGGATDTKSCLSWSTPTDPSPNQGWQGLERKSLPNRGRPELARCLALIHHIVIGANVPMADFLGWLASLGTALVIEFVDRNDEMVETLLRNKEDCYTDYSLENFERHLEQHEQSRRRTSLKIGSAGIILPCHAQTRAELQRVEISA